MSDCRKYVDYIMEQAKNLLAIDSPSGYGREVTEYLLKELEALGVQARRTVKGGVIADFGGRNKEDGILLEAHCDTLGGMVAQIKENGRLKLTNIGGMKPANAEAENVRIITKADGIYEGTCQLVDASVHVNGSYEKTERTWDTVEVLVDEDVTCREDAVKLGIMPGDYVCFEPRTRITSSGYIKSRFLDDKASSGVLLGIAKYVSEHPGCLKRNVQLFFTTFEEIGHGASAGIPEEIEDLLAVDMGCVGDHLACTEKQVSICAKDSSGAYHFEMTNELIEVAKEHGIDYAVDIYPSYGSDAGAALRSGKDVRYALIGQGVYASHGYERTHKDGMKQTFELALNYVLK